jgi:hypothetical protein
MYQFALMKRLRSFSLEQVIISDIAPTETFWDLFIKNHILVNLFLYRQINFPRSRRLLVLS